MTMATAGNLVDGARRGTSGLAVFDLDGTLVRGDTLLPFLLSFLWTRRRVGRLVILPVPILLYAARVWSAHTAKQWLLECTLRDESAAVIASHAEWFTSTWVARRLRTRMLGCLREHQVAGDRVVLLSASPDVYVGAIARRLGIEEVVCTEVAFRDGRCLGRIVGSNCKGIAKIERLQAHLRCEEAPEVSYAYGDSRSDLPLLRWVRSGYLITNRSEIIKVM